MSFARQEATNWRNNVPGVRWFKADLHIHTIDDLPGGRSKVPSGIQGDLKSTTAIGTYARRLLQSAVNQGVQILGITPHSPRMGASGETSAVWRVVEEWNSGVDDLGIPFREQIYAVFPGFEPSLHDGKSGLHLIFLFDPEIGREKFLRAFDLIMGGVSPWPEGSGNQLRMSSRSAEEAFSDLREFHERECPKTQEGEFLWNYLVLAPHIDQEKGLLGAQRSQVLELFKHDEVAGLELGDNKLPEDTLVDREWLREGMAEHKQSFFHSTDAYSVEEIGTRHTWLKIASPRIEALRQAFIASDSRIRIGYERGQDGSLCETSNPPDVMMNARPWLKSVTVSGEASFFGVSNENEQGICFNLSPDLTCIIGGSMTGKSTLLDGLRVHIGAPLPQDENVRKQVEVRGKDRFLAGSPKVVLECPGRDTTASLSEQWPAVFYTQSELQRLAENPQIAEDILSLLVTSETQGIKEHEGNLRVLDRELARDAKLFGDMNESLADAEQAHERSKMAAAELDAFSDAGVDDLNRASSEMHQWQAFTKASKDLESQIENVTDSATKVDIPEIADSLENALQGAGISERGPELLTRWNRVVELLRSAVEEAKAANTVIQSITDTAQIHESDVRIQVNRKLAEQGLDASRINQLQAMSEQASLLASHEANLLRVRAELADLEDSFEKSLEKRRELVEQQREAFDRVIETVYQQFCGRIMARRINDGNKETLDKFVRDLGQRGITRWWNDLDHEERPSPSSLLSSLSNNCLEVVGMSSAVQETFVIQLTPSKQRELAALRSQDTYVLEFRMDDGTYRVLEDLSGGQRVNLLLSLLLETSDERPLVIDQPEDELDNRFLFETMLPVLKRLKGRRQIIVATHNANIVVNGDADQVIHLEATANRGQIANSGAIEEPTIRGAIVRTVDGGEEAFRMRRLKYGF